MRTDLFDFDLPQDRIALRPASPRDAARLMVVRPGADPELEDRAVRDLPDLLRPGDRAKNRGDAHPAARRVALARAGQAGEETRRGRRGAVRRGRQGLLPRP